MSEMLKAWIVIGEEWTELFHAETRGKARYGIAMAFSASNAIVEEEFLTLRAIRFPDADGRAFTIADRRKADGEDVERDDRYISDCFCIHCHPELNERKDE